MYFYLKLVIFAKLLFATAVSTYEVISAINCGGVAFTDSDGHQYSKDTNYSAEAINFSWNTNAILMNGVAEVNRPLYLYFTFSRYPQVLTYQVSVTGDGSYALILKFSDTENSKQGQHIFSVTMNGQPILDNVDIFERNGNKVYDEVIKFQICDGLLVLPSLEPVAVGNLLDLGFHPVKSIATIDAILLLKGYPGEKIFLTSSPSSVSPLTFDYKLCAPVTTTTISTTNATSSTTTAPTTSRPVNPNIWQKLLTSIVNVQNTNNTYINVVNNFDANKNKDAFE